MNRVCQFFDLRPSRERADTDAHAALLPGADGLVRQPRAVVSAADCNPVVCVERAVTSSAGMPSILNRVIPVFLLAGGP